MERGTANILRVLGIIGVSLITLLACGVLLLLGMCAGGLSGSRQLNLAVPWFIGAIAVMVGGIWMIVRLARGKGRSSGAPPGAASGIAPQPALSEPLVISSEGRKAIDLVVFALGASLVWSLISWFLNQAAFAAATRNMAGGNRLLIPIVILVLYNIPYAVLLYGFLTRAARWMFYCAVAVPAVLFLLSLFNTFTARFYYLHNSQAFLRLAVSWAIDIAILAMTWRAMRKNGIQPDPPPLLAAALLAFIYFLIVRHGATFLYRVFAT